MLPLRKVISTIIHCLLVLSCFGQQKIDLSDKFQNKKINVVNRNISLNKGDNDAVEMDANKGDGLGILEEVKFEKGIIEIELLGENNPGKSFIGIAFNVQDNETYEAIYFRPFNFVAKEAIRKKHMVQYIYHPEFTWRKLRTERTGEFESEISMPPDPDKWFKAIIKVYDDKVEVYLGGQSEAVLTINRLTTTKSDKIALWTGFGSSGRFKNLIIKAQ